MILLKSLHSEGLLSHDEGRRPLGFFWGVGVFLDPASWRGMTG